MSNTAATGLATGERPSTSPSVAGDIVFYTTTTETAATPCADFTAKLYGLTYAGGAAYDANNNGKIDTTESPVAKTVAGRATAPFIVDQHLVLRERLRRHRGERRGVRRSRRLQQRRRPGRRADPVMARNQVGERRHWRAGPGKPTKEAAAKPLQTLLIVLVGIAVVGIAAVSLTRRETAPSAALPLVIPTVGDAGESRPKPPKRRNLQPPWRPWRSWNPPRPVRRPIAPVIWRRACPVSRSGHAQPRGCRSAQQPGPGPGPHAEAGRGVAAFRQGHRR